MVAYDVINLMTSVDGIRQDLKFWQIYLFSAALRQTREAAQIFWTQEVTSEYWCILFNIKYSMVKAKVSILSISKQPVQCIVLSMLVAEHKVSCKIVIRHQRILSPMGKDNPPHAPTPPLPPPHKKKPQTGDEQG